MTKVDPVSLKINELVKILIKGISNYCVIDETAPSTLVLPNQWMWDIIDEFIYQFQSFCQYRAKIMNKTEEEVLSLKENVHKVNSHLFISLLFISLVILYV